MILKFIAETLSKAKHYILQDFKLLLKKYVKITPTGTCPSIQMDNRRPKPGVIYLTLSEIKSNIQYF
ncbi:MAG TPA: hypothetical protein DER09_01800 [Prolixibacteraceae bacterium]|nr:hypothetical protein [Prolixibacteraceae bacterium]